MWNNNKMKNPTTKERIMKFIEMLTTLNGFIMRSSQDTLSFYRLLWEEVHFGWTLKYEKNVAQLKISI